MKMDTLLDKIVQVLKKQHKEIKELQGVGSTYHHNYQDIVDDLNKIDVQSKGPPVENNALFPEKTNVQFVKILDRTHIKLKVWERGSGITLASGSSSCAAVDAGIRRDLLDNKVKVELDGGTVEVEKKVTGVWLTGPTKHVFSGIYNLIRN